MLAIWMTGSWLASGKIPFLPAHSISKLRIRSGAILDHSPSGGCEMNLSHLCSLERKYGRYSLDDAPHGNFDLALRPLRMDEGVVARRDLDPVHANDFCVNHEP